MRAERIPTPFSRDAVTDEDDYDHIHATSGVEARCFVPACTRNVPELTSPYIVLELLVLTELKHEEGTSLKLYRFLFSDKAVRIRFVSCPEHGHVMKGRKQKKSIDLHQHSRVRNLLETVSNRSYASVKKSLNEYYELRNKK